MSPRTPEKLDWKAAVKWIGLAIVAFVGYVLVTSYRPGEKPGEKTAEQPRPSVFGLSPSATPPTPPPSAADAAAKQAAEEKVARDAQTRQQEADAKQVALRARIAALKADGDEVREALAAFDRLAGTWKGVYEPLRTDEAGKRIAADPKQLAFAAAVFGRERPTPRQRLGWQERLDQLLVPVARFEGDPNTPVVVTDDTLALTAQLLTTVRAANKEWQTDQAALDAAKAATATSPPAAHTLTSGFEQRLAAERQVQLTRVEEARKAAVKKHTDELAAIEAETAKAKTAAETANALAQLEKAKHDQKMAELGQVNAKKKQEQEWQAAAARAQLLREYERDLPTIRATLPAFITPGKGLRQKGSNGPLSLAYIQGKGALADTRAGMKAFCTIARENNDRPAGPIPYFLGSDREWDALDKDGVKAAQALITKYGEIMVEKGLLAP